MIFTIYNCKIVEHNKMHCLFIATTVVHILLSMRKYMSRSKQIIYLCNITMKLHFNLSPNDYKKNSLRSTLQTILTAPHILTLRSIHTLHTPYTESF